MTTILFLKAIYSTENKVIIFTKILIIEPKFCIFLSNWFLDKLSWKSFSVSPTVFSNWKVSTYAQAFRSLSIWHVYSFVSFSWLNWKFTIVFSLELSFSYLDWENRLINFIRYENTCKPPWSNLNILQIIDKRLSQWFLDDFGGE